MSVRDVDDTSETPGEGMDQMEEPQNNRDENEPVTVPVPRYVIPMRRTGSQSTTSSTPLSPVSVNGQKDQQRPTRVRKPPKWLSSGDFIT